MLNYHPISALNLVFESPPAECVAYFYIYLGSVESCRITGNETVLSEIGIYFGVGMRESGALSIATRPPVNMRLSGSTGR